MIAPATSGPLGHVALIHEDKERCEELARLLRTAGHRASVLVPGRRIVQSVVDCAPDLVLASHSLGDPPMATVVRGLRQAVGMVPQDGTPRMLLAMQLANEGKLAEAIHFLGPIAYDPHPSEGQAAALALIQQLRRFSRAFVIKQHAHQLPTIFQGCGEGVA